MLAGSCMLIIDKLVENTCWRVNEISNYLVIFVIEPTLVLAATILFSMPGVGKASLWRLFKLTLASFLLPVICIWIDISNICPLTQGVCRARWWSQRESDLRAVFMVVLLVCLHSGKVRLRKPGKELLPLVDLFTIYFVIDRVWRVFECGAKNFVDPLEDCMVVSTITDRRTVRYWFYSIFQPLFSYFLFKSLVADTNYWRGFFRKAAKVEGSRSNELISGLDSVDSEGAFIDKPLLLIRDENAEDFHSMLDAGTKLIDFALVEYGPAVGKGTTAIVYSGAFKDVGPVAIKQFTPKEINSAEITACCKEMALLSSLKHPNVIQFHGLCVNPPHFSLIFEFCSQGALANHLSRVAKSNWEAKVTVCLELTSVVAFLHSKKPPIVHRDLKPDNFLVRNNGSVVLADFGAGRVTEQHGLAQTFVGSPLWMAPEMYVDVYDHRVDLYSLGIMLWQMVTGSMPFAEFKSWVNLEKAVLKGLRPSLTLPAFTQVPAGFVQIISDLWQTDPKLRPSAQEALARLESIAESIGALAMCGAARRCTRCFPTPVKKKKPSSK